MKNLLKGLLVSLIISLLAACESKLSDTEYVEKARTYLDQGKVKAATIELKNAIQSNPENAQARWLLGKEHLDLGNGAAAEKELRRASDLGVADESISPLLARALLMQQRYDELFKISPQKINGAVQKAEVMAAQALGYLARRKGDEARQRMDEAISLAPDAPYVGVAKARLLATEKKAGDARDLVEKVIKRHPDYAPAWTLLAELEVLDKQWAKADAAYTKSIDNRLDDRLDLLSRVLVRIQMGELDKAQTDIDTLKKQIPANPVLNYAQGLIFYQKGRLQDAKESFEVALKANDRHALAIYYLGLTHFRLGNREQAEKFAERYYAMAPNSIPGRKLVATIDLMKGKYQSAERLVSPIVAYRGDDATALILLASALMGQQKTEEALKLLEKVVSLKPDSAMARMNLGRALLQAGKSAEGVAYVEKSIQADPKQTQAYLILIAHYLGADQLDHAIKVAKDYRDHMPDSAASWDLVGRLLVLKKQFEEAKGAFRQALKIEPADVLANFSLAAMAVKEKNYKEARRYYQSVLNAHDDHLGTLLNLAALDALENNKEEMFTHLHRAALKHPRVIRPQVMLARYYLLKAEPGRVAPLMLELSDEQKKDPAVLEVSALAQLAQRQYSAAKYTLEQLLDTRPKVAQFHFLLARANGELKDRAGLIRELGKTIELEPGHQGAHMALARLAFFEGDADKVEHELEILEDIAPEDPQVLRLKAAMAQANGNPEAASTLLKEAFEKAPDTAAMLSAARQKWSMGEGAIALELEERWVKEHPEDTAASLGLAGSYIRLGNAEKAVEIYRQLLKENEKNVVVLNDLAWLLRERSPEESLGFAQLAYDLAPDSASVMDTLAITLLKNGEVEKAQRTIAKALDKAPNNPSIQYHSAMIQSAAGKKEQALKTLHKLLQGKAVFPEKKDAAALLARLRGE